MNCAEVKKWRIILGEEERETILQALGKMLFTAAFLQSALYPSAPQWGAGRASALQDSYREGEPLLGKCLASCCSTEMGFTRMGAALAGGACLWPEAGEPPLPPGRARCPQPQALHSSRLPLLMLRVTTALQQKGSGQYGPVWPIPPSKEVGSPFFVAGRNQGD